MSTPAPRLTLVVNPSSGRGRARRLLPRVLADLRSGLPDADVRVVETTSYEDARTKCAEVVASARPDSAGVRRDTLLVMGGDGMAHLGVNACGGTRVPLGIVPAGTGNDFCRGTGAATTVPDAVASIVAGNTKRIDLMEVTGRLLSGARRGLVGSIVSTGYDARVNLRGNTMRWSMGSLAYTWAALVELRGFHPLAYRLVVDGVPRDLDAMFIAVGNAGVLGGGMWACPRADVGDGWLDLTIVHPVSRTLLIRLLPKMFDGSFAEHPAVELTRARVVRVDGDGLYGMADGEQLGPVPLTCAALPAALTLLVP